MDLVDLGGEGGALAEVGGGMHEGGWFEGFGAAHGAAVLHFKDALDAGMAEDVGAGGNDGSVECVEADGAVFAGFDAQLEQVLKCFLVLGREVDDFLLVQGGEDGSHAVSAEFPVVAHLSHSKQNLQEVARFTGAFAFLMHMKEPLSFGPA